ncbi:MAG TPA: NfeD family protein [Bryobacteraceae bacterium]|jgi:inner membrane protein|nr:NfeD family protein [Bryobacteraceae bacterium]
MEPATLAWWMWMIAGIALLGIEMLTPGGFFTLFFGAGAIVVGLLGLAGWQPSIPVQGLIFLAVSIASLLLFRKPLMERFQSSIPKGKVDSLVGETAIAMEEIPAGGMGKAELRGSSWSARNLGDAPIHLKQRVRVERIDGLTLDVRA